MRGPRPWPGLGGTSIRPSEYRNQYQDYLYIVNIGGFQQHFVFNDTVSPEDTCRYIMKSLQPEIKSLRKEYEAEERRYALGKPKYTISTTY